MEKSPRKSHQDSPVASHSSSLSPTSPRRRGVTLQSASKRNTDKEGGSASSPSSSPSPTSPRSRMVGQHRDSVPIRTITRPRPPSSSTSGATSLVLPPPPSSAPLLTSLPTSPSSSSAVRRKQQQSHLSSSSSSPSLRTGTATTDIEAFSEILYCQTKNVPLIQTLLARHHSALLITDHATPIDTYSKCLCSVKGVFHDELECRLCADKHYTSDPFVNQKEAKAEREAVIMLTATGLGTVQDGLTWLAAHREWLRMPLLMHYFNQTYPVVAEAITKVNLLPARHLDRRYTATSTSGTIGGGVVIDRSDAPVYCNWLYLPDPERSAVFYVLTRYPEPERIHAYLNVVLGVPNELTRMIVEATITNGEHKRRLLSQRLTAHAEASAVEAQYLATNSGVEHEDVRRRRAERLEKRHELRAFFDVETPRLMLISEDGSITALQRRPDYVLRQHAHYINVFNISLSPNAPPYYEAPYDSSSDDEEGSGSGSSGNNGNPFEDFA